MTRKPKDMNDRHTAVLHDIIPSRIIVCVALVSCLASALRAADLEVHGLPAVVYQKTRMLNADYLAAVPVIEHREAKLPLLIFLHGAGGRGRDITRVKRIARPALAGMEHFAGEPSIFVAPQATEGTKEIPASWLPNDLDRFLAHLKSTLPVDEDRVYVTGNSMGGYGTWAWAAHSPKQFAAAAPVVGGLGKGGPKDITPDLDQWAANLAKLPVWAFHGANDKVVPADRSERMIKLIRDKGGKSARLTVFPNEGHGASRKVYTSREFFEWLFAQNAEGRGEADNFSVDQQDQQDTVRTTATETHTRESNGLAPEVTDLNAEDVSYQREHKLPYLAEPFIDVHPEDMDEGIPVGELGCDGGNKEDVLNLARELARQSQSEKSGNTDSLLICYRGKLLLEAYFRRGRINYPHYQMSITKSYTAMALGRAIQLGHLTMADLHKPAISFLKDLNPATLVEGADQITLHQAMHMSSGIRLDPDKAAELRKSPEQLKSQAQIQAYLENSEPIPPAPRIFKYQASDPAITMQVLESVVPGSAKDFIRKELWARLGVDNYQWQPDISGLPKSAAGSSIRSRDMLKMGLLVLNNGKWKGEQLIPAEFVQRATNPICKTGGQSSYGYFWWTQDYEIAGRTYHSKQGRGAGGQFIFMFPALDLIAIVTAHNKGMGNMLRTLPQKLIPAFVDHQ